MWDISEFLLHLYDKGELDTNFQRIDVTIPYHAPCQVKSQGLGKPAIELMSLIPGVTVKDSEQPCCGIAGTYGMKKEKYAIAQAVGAPVFDSSSRSTPSWLLVTRRRVVGSCVRPQVRTSFTRSG